MKIWPLLILALGAGACSSPAHKRVTKSVAATHVQYWRNDLPRVEFPVVKGPNSSPWAESHLDFYTTWLDPERPPRAIDLTLPGSYEKHTLDVTRVDVHPRMELAKGSAGSLDDYLDGHAYRYKWRIVSIPEFWVSPAEQSRLKSLGSSETLDTSRWPRQESKNGRRWVIVKRAIPGIDDAPPPEPGAKVVSRTFEEQWGPELPRVAFEPVRSSEKHAGWVDAGHGGADFYIPGSGKRFRMVRFAGWRTEVEGSEKEEASFKANPNAFYWKVEAIPATFIVRTVYNRPGPNGMEGPFVKIETIKEQPIHARRVITFKSMDTEF